MQLAEGIGGSLDLAALAEQVPETEDLLEQEDDAPIIRLINAILGEAIKENASDIHLETVEKRLVVRFRVDGILLVTGPTGSGKTTTLYASLVSLNDRTRNILTVEDPIEYHLEGIGQTQVNSKVDMTFARGLRAILRQDPDVVMVGEIRDKETAEIAVQASLAGHLVLSTLHTNSAIGAITHRSIWVLSRSCCRRPCSACWRSRPTVRPTAS
jgi:type II secretory ATPase GspE/PulE/Tfp pilus assembly ATPase PilB-like protein